MAFMDDLKEWAEKAQKIVNQVNTEEATKHALVLPFLQLLGYNVFDPTEIVPEFMADVPGIKKSEKVDYAIVIDGVPTILIEVKPANEPLSKHSAQLARYFHVTEAKFAVLTNGIEYWFFTDLEDRNKMDSKPFLVFNLFSIKEPLVSEIEKFSKGKFDAKNILSRASELKYLNELRNYFERNFKDPSDEFAKFIVRQVYEGRALQQVINRFKGLIKKAVHNVIADEVNERIKSALEKTAPKEHEADKDREDVKTTGSAIVTTEEELEAWALAKYILKDVVPDGHEVTYKDTINYFVITLDNSASKWICRLYLNFARKYIEFRGGDKVDIEKSSDIVKFADRIMSITKEVLGLDSGAIVQE